MKTTLLTIGLAFIATVHQASAHSWKASETDKEVMRAHVLADWEAAHSQVSSGASKPVQVASTGSVLAAAAAAVANEAGAPGQARAFQAFPKLTLTWDKDFLYVGGNGLPDHNMMVGITAWQQQVPLPQNYTGDNAWRVPLHPVVAKTPAVIEGRFLRGAIAIAVNGIPIFNPQNNRGEVSYEIGELDQWGGHCGRADDYHYHIAPLHLESVVGKGMPVAYALDGYPIYGLTEPDGSTLGKLDECHGHDDAKIGYHYHGSTKRPYLQSAFHGEVVEADGQVDPQPRAEPIRESLTPMRGAEIVDLKTAADGKSRSLTYKIGSKKGSVNFAAMEGGAWKFEFISPDGTKEEQIYQSGGRRGGGGEGKRSRDGGGPPPGPGGEGKGKGKGMGKGEPKGKGDQKERGPREPQASSTAETLQKPDGHFALTSPEVADNGPLPIDYTGDGSGATLPLAWNGVPAGTQGYALLMDHVDPEGKMKWYWTLYDIPANVTSLPKNVQGVGKVGTAFKGKVGYEPPHSQGPGAKTYVLTVYALSEPLHIKQEPAEVRRDVLISAMKGKVLATSSLHVIATRGEPAGGEGKEPRREGGGPMVVQNEPPPRPDASPAGEQGGQRKPWIQMHGPELDTDKDGIVTAVETAADMKRAFALYDADKDGVISPKEIDAAGDIREGAAFAGLIFRHAIELDANNDSSLTTQEAMAVAKYTFESADADHDGS